MWVKIRWSKLCVILKLLQRTTSRLLSEVKRFLKKSHSCPNYVLILKILCLILYGNGLLIFLFFIQNYWRHNFLSHLLCFNIIQKWMFCFFFFLFWPTVHSVVMAYERYKTVIFFKSIKSRMIISFCPFVTPPDSYSTHFWRKKCWYKMFGNRYSQNKVCLKQILIHHQVNSHSFLNARKLLASAI